MNAPGTEQLIGIGESNVPPFVVGEVEVVLAEPPSYPIRDLDKRWPLNVGSDARVQIGCDDGTVKQALNPNRSAVGLRKNRRGRQEKDTRAPSRW